ncbi:MAG TPA: hypothetical protein VMB34_23710 [Acetobacteraceae bacterium]|nr:hypothetical protein [Acetobacteraceae bacterium]
MAARKGKEASPAVDKSTTTNGAAERTVAAASVPATPEAADNQRLLREAAWSRMFGRTEAKNPFTRTR